MNYLTLLIPLKSRHYSDYLGAQKSKRILGNCGRETALSGEYTSRVKKLPAIVYDISDESALALGLMKIFSAKN